MSPAVPAESDGDQRERHVSKLIFFLFVFGAVLLCVGVLLSVFGFQVCQYKAFLNCSLVLKAAGPTCAVIGMGSVILARSWARLQFLQGRLRGNPVDHNRAFLCGETRQFAQYLVFGFLFLTSGLLISILGIWVPGCGAGWAHAPLNETDMSDTEYPVCGFLTLQIMGPLVVLAGLCFLVIAHLKKRKRLSADQDALESEDTQTQSTESVQVTVGDAVIIFPPPPPPYFPDSSASAVTQSLPANSLLPNESPPPYYSIFNHGRTPSPEGQAAASEREHGSVYTISGTSSSSEISGTPHLPSEPPPRYEEKEITAATSLSPSSEPSPP